MTDEEKLVAIALSERLNAVSKQVDAVLMLVGAALLPEGEQRREAMLMGEDLIEKASESLKKASALADMVNKVWEEARHEP